MTGRHLAIVALVIGASACGISVTGIEPGPASGVDGGSGGGGGIDSETPGGDASTPEPEEDAGPRYDAGVLPDVNGCPSGRGPAMIRSGKICFDSTEVTRAQYAAFLEHETLNGLVPSLARECRPKTGHVPTGWDGVKAGALPVVNVDWCDADSFCAWSGKQLCGGPDGKPQKTGAADFAKADKDPWYAACSRDGERDHPYGDMFMPAFCNVASNAAVPPADTANLNCVGGYDGLRDMVGNVWDHVDACAADKCIVRGGSFKTQATDAHCRARLEITRMQRLDDTGIRCCAYLP